jgi:hypothetical protein
MIPSNRPLAAFYTYSAACGVFSCISTGLFMPIFLERTSSSLSPTGLIAKHIWYSELARSHGQLGPGGGECGQDEGCSVRLMGIWVDTTAYR